jgi:hypothetical protein
MLWQQNPVRTLTLCFFKECLSLPSGFTTEVLHLSLSQIRLCYVSCQRYRIQFNTHDNIWWMLQSMTLGRMWFPATFFSYKAMSIHTRVPVQQGTSLLINLNTTFRHEPHESRIDCVVKTDCLYDERHSDASGMKNRVFTIIILIALITDAARMNGQKFANFFVVPLSHYDSFIML